MKYSHFCIVREEVSTLELQGKSGALSYRLYLPQNIVMVTLFWLRPPTLLGVVTIEWRRFISIAKFGVSFN